MKVIGIKSSVILMLTAPPLAGLYLRGFPADFCAFPPLNHEVVHPAFNLPVFVIYAALFLLSVIILILPGCAGFAKVDSKHTSPSPHAAFPIWGQLGLVLMTVSWTCAWGKFDWLGPIRPHLFTPLWLSYILIIDGIIFRNNGRSMISTSPRRFAALFPTSAVIWWYFEFTNRFIQNWWYEGVDHFSAAQYILFATLAFSTVLPAILETSRLFSESGWFLARYRHGPALSVRHTRRTAILAMFAGCTGLFAMALNPDRLFFMAWLSPLAISAGVLALRRVKTPFSGIVSGDYSHLFSLALGALTCGFFWEMWNYWSYPKWHYSIPYVSTLRLFEMPIVGYAGYLPFGPACWCLYEVFRCEGFQKSESSL